MRVIVLALVVGCGGPVSSQAPQQPAPAPHVHAAPCPAPAAAGTDTRVPRRAEILVELERIDRELDAIDADLVAAAQHQGITLSEARVQARAAKKMLEDMRFDAPISDFTPILLARAQRAWLAAATDKARLATQLGARHPHMKLAELRVAFRRDVVEQQLHTERKLAAEWIAALDRLPSSASNTHAVRIEVLRKVLAEQLVPSDAPARVRLAREQLVEATWRRDELAMSFGGKNPELVAAEHAMSAARDALAAAIGEADAELATRSKAPSKSLDAAAISRRGALAESARELRLEYELLAK